MQHRKLPNPPADVLAMFDLLPPDLREKIELHMVAYSMESFVKLGRQPSENQMHKVMLRDFDEFCRLIREAASEAGISV